MRRFGMDRLAFLRAEQDEPGIAKARSEVSHYNLADDGDLIRRQLVERELEGRGMMVEIAVHQEVVEDRTGVVDMLGKAGCLKLSPIVVEKALPATSLDGRIRVFAIAHRVPVRLTILPFSGGAKRRPTATACWAAPRHPIAPGMPGACLS